MDLRMRFERGLTPGLLALPDAALARAVGRLFERPVTRGVTMDLRASLLLALDRRLHAPLESFDPVRARAEADRRVRVGLGPPADGVEVGAVTLEHPELEAPLPARLYRPRGPRRGPLIVYFHQGGLVFGDPSWARPFASILVGTLAARVVAIAYPRAPEVPLPRIRQAAELGARVARARAEAWGAAPGRWAVAGDAAGGTLAALVAAGLPPGHRPDAQLLVHPLLDFAARTRSRTELAHAHPVSSAFLGWARAHALPAGADPEDPRISPGRRAALGDLPPAVIATAGFDPLLDEGDAHARRLAEAGVPVRHRRHLELPHGFSALAGVLPRAGDALRALARDLGRML